MIPIAIGERIHNTSLATDKPTILRMKGIKKSSHDS